MNCHSATIADAKVFANIEIDSAFGLPFGLPRLFFSTRLKGLYIVNAQTKVPLQDAFVLSEDASFNKEADENGFVSLKKLPSSVSKLNISRIGFESKSIALDSLPTTNNMAIVYLQAKVSSLREVRVKATAISGVFKAFIV